MDKISIGNDKVLAITVFKQDDPTVPRFAATGLSLTCWLSAVQDGVAIDPMLSGPATEKPDRPGTYLGSFLGTNMTPLVPYVNRVVYLCVSDGSAINRCKPILVVSSMTVPT